MTRPVEIKLDSLSLLSTGIILTTDRGLYAEWLYNQIQSVGWHPFMRINQQGQFQHHGQKQWCTQVLKSHLKLGFVALALK
ncbi:MAG: hypothetical protein V7L25_25145 [Nostoc sp.]|uniref:hypothetical protein n=1 Tax=Nostoc sp. TaxID=1180 RepID=UPI002FF25049